MKPGADPEETLVALLARVHTIPEHAIALETGLEAHTVEALLRWLELRHAIQRVGASVHTTIELRRVISGKGDDDGFAVLRFAPQIAATMDPAPFEQWPAVREALEIVRKAPLTARESTWADDQLVLVDNVAIDRARDALMEVPDEELPVLAWDDREVLLGPLETAVARFVGAERWRAERDGFEAAILSAARPLTHRDDAWGDDAFLDLKLAALGRILGDAGRRTLLEAILRTYQIGAWPRFLEGSYPDARILCVALRDG